MKFLSRFLLRSFDLGVFDVVVLVIEDWEEEVVMGVVVIGFGFVEILMFLVSELNNFLIDGEVVIIILGLVVLLEMMLLNE